jgi:hypothetical protein
VTETDSESQDRTPNKPTMAGFTWSESVVTPEMRRLPGDLYCVRDSIAALLGWEPGSEEWACFIEAPNAADVDRMIDHLGLDWCDPERQPEKFRTFLDHPGISVYAFHTMRMSHYLYQPHLRKLRPLPVQYLLVEPNRELFRIIADLRQRPHTNTLSR